MAIPYIVEQHDTMYRIAKKFGVNLTALENANPQIADLNVLYPGQVIQIPEVYSNSYMIQPGDTFYRIAQRFNVTLESLRAANPDLDPSQLQIGQIIIIPSGPANQNQIVDPTMPYGYIEMMEDLERMRERYPFLQIGAVGESVLGKIIPVVILGRGSKKIHYNGSFHANEWITTTLLMKFIEDYAAAYASGQPFRGEDLNSLFNAVSLWIVPMVNPDGVELVQEGLRSDNPYYDEIVAWNQGSLDFSGWKANIRGVDLNDQYPAHWEEERERRSPSGPAPRDFVGYAPLTEPEAVAIAELTRNEDFSLVMAFHTQGEVIFWNYRDLEPPESEIIVERLSEASGYEPVKIFNSDAGYKDWFIQDFRRPGFTIEAGRGVNPLPLSEFPRIYADIAPLMLEGIKVAVVD